jgi:Protein of unknown function (DUF4232)
MRNRVRLLILPSSIAIVGCIAACGSSGSGGSASSGGGSQAAGVSTTVMPTPPPQHTRVPATSSGTGANASVTTHVPVSRAKPCTGSALQVTASRETSADRGHADLQIRFTNVGKPACTLIGYPGAAAVDSAEHVTGNAHQHSRSGGAKSVFVPSGGHAVAVLEWSTTVSNGNVQCTKVEPAFEVTPPNTYSTTTIDYQVGVCSLQIYPVQGA